MELNVSYCIPKDDREWRYIKPNLKPSSVHLCIYFAQQDKYHDKKTILNMVSRMNNIRSSFYVICPIQFVSYIIEICQETCELFPNLKYNYSIEHCPENINVIVHIGPGLLDHGSVHCVKYKSLSDLDLSIQNRIYDSSIRQEVCVTIGDKAFDLIAKEAKDNARYVVAFNRASSGIKSRCLKMGMSYKAIGV